MEKNNLSLLVKVIVLFIYAVLNIVTYVGVWNDSTDGFVKVCASLLFIANGAVVFFCSRKLKAELDED